MILLCILIFKEKTSVYKILSPILSAIGVLMFLESNAGVSMVGFLLSLFSAMSYAFMMMYMEKSGLENLHPIKLSFFLYVSV